MSVLLLTDGEIIGIIWGAIVGLIVLYLLILSLWNITVVAHKSAVIVERWGKFHAQWDSGLHWLVPIMDKIRPVTWRETETFMEQGQAQSRVVETQMKRVDLRQGIMDFPLQPIITRDNVEIQVHPMLLYELIDPIRVAYETYDLSYAVEKLVQTTLRSVIGDMGLDDTLASREEINRSITQKIHQICYNWGMNIFRVELLEIIPTRTVQEAMHQQLAAERVRRAAIVTADGYREQVKTEAEGMCQSQISLAAGEQQVSVLDAKGSAEGKVIIATAEAQALKTITDALKPFGVHPTQYMIGLRYIETFLKVASTAAKRDIYFPMETNIAGAFAAKA